MINNTLWDGNTIDVADCLMTMPFDSYSDWCSDFFSVVHKFIRNGFNVYSTKFKEFRNDIRECGSFEPKDKLEMTFIGLKKDVLTSNNVSGFVEHIETDYDDDVYKLSIPTFYNMTRASGKRIANCLHWLEVHSQYMLPMTINDIKMVKMLSEENHYDTDKVEKARLKNARRKKYFELVFWWEQFVEWKDETKEAHFKLGETMEKYKEEHKDVINSCWSINGKYYVKGEEVEPPEEVKEYERLKNEYYSWWAEDNFFTDTFKKIKANLTREEIQKALVDSLDKMYD